LELRIIVRVQPLDFGAATEAMNGFQVQMQDRAGMSLGGFVLVDV
jgi:hypothetical protein